jgi:hypothetical protein
MGFRLRPVLKSRPTGRAGLMLIEDRRIGDYARAPHLLVTAPAC